MPSVIEMNIDYKRQHNESYMVIEVENGAPAYEARMIEENEISSLLKYTKINVNGVTQYSYCISRKENLEDFLEARDLTLDIFRRIILNLQLAYEEVEKYLIDESHIYLSKETVFLEKSKDSFKVNLCYYPKNMGGVQQQFRELMEFFLKLVPSDNRELAAQIYNAYDLCLKSDYTLGEILDSLEPKELEQEIYIEQIDPYNPTEPLKNNGIVEEFIPQGESLSELYEQQACGNGRGINTFLEAVKSFLNMRIQFKDEVDEQREDFIIDPDYELEEKTVLLTDVKPSGKLVYDGQNQEDDFLVNKDIFRIGSSKTNDAVIKEKTVSSNHAKITREGDDYYLSDLNSTNSTYLNSKPLTYRHPEKLKIMDKISFANVTYTFM